MPYIMKEDRSRAKTAPESPGELNFAITAILDSYLSFHGLKYITINDAIGVLECAKLELYRRLAAPYEEIKRAQNGEVYKTQVPGYVRPCTEPPVNGC